MSVEVTRPRWLHMVDVLTYFLPSSAALSKASLPAPLAQTTLPLLGPHALSLPVTWCLWCLGICLWLLCGLWAAVRGRAKRREEQLLRGRSPGPTVGRSFSRCPSPFHCPSQGLYHLLLYCSPGKRQGFHVTDEAMEAQRGRMTCPKACT